MNRIIITTFDYKKKKNILAAKVLYMAKDRILGAHLFCLLVIHQLACLHTTYDKKGVFQITVDLKNVQIKNQVVTKC